MKKEKKQIAPAKKSTPALDVLALAMETFEAGALVATAMRAAEDRDLAITLATALGKLQTLERALRAAETASRMPTR